MLVLFGMMILTVTPSTALAGVGKEDHTLIDYTSADSWPAPPPTDAPAIFAMELNSGAVIYDKAGEEIHYPASTTKTMTALLALENCELDEEVTFSSKAINDIESGGHHFEFQEGEVLTVDECIQFLLVESVNECAYALAEHVAGSMDAFVDMMNAKAVELGATNTHFNNAHGLNDEEHVTTAHDMAMILWGCIQDPRFQQYADIQSISLRGRAIRTSGFTSYDNHHEMLLYSNKHYDPDVVCGKTGFTSIAGSTLVTYGHRNDMDVIVVIMQGEDQLRFEDTRAILDYAFDNFELVSAQELNRELLTEEGSAMNLGETIDSGDILLLPKNRREGSLTSEFLPRGEDNQDTRMLGSRNWYYDGVPAGTSVITLGARDHSLYVEGDEVDNGVTVSKVKSGSSSGKVLFGLTPKELIILAVLALVLLLLLLVLLTLIRRNRREKREDPDREIRKEKKNKSKAKDDLAAALPISEKDKDHNPENPAENQSEEEEVDHKYQEDPSDFSSDETEEEDFAIDLLDLTEGSETSAMKPGTEIPAEVSEKTKLDSGKMLADLKESKVAEETEVLKDRMTRLLKSTRKGVSKVAKVSVASVEKAKDIWAAMDQEQPPLETPASRKSRKDQDASVTLRHSKAEAESKRVSGSARSPRPAAAPASQGRPSTASRPAAVPKTEALVHPASPKTVTRRTPAPVSGRENPLPKAADSPTDKGLEHSILQLDEDMALTFEEVPTGQYGKHKTYRMTLKRSDSHEE